MEANMKILIIAAHMDDEVLGCGGTISKHIDEGNEVAVIYICGRAYFNVITKKMLKREEDCARKVCNLLGINYFKFLHLHDEQLDHRIIDVVKPIEEEIIKFKPDIIYTHHRADNNQDHKAVFNATMIATRSSADWQPQKVYCYEVLSSTEQSPQFNEYSYLPTTYVDIEKYLDKKIEAFECYKYEMHPYPHPRSPEAIKALAMYRGMTVNLKYAEAFVLVREIVK